MCSFVDLFVFYWKNFGLMAEKTLSMGRPAGLVYKTKGVEYLVIKNLFITENGN
jgi:uncharacterized membrane protein